MAGRALLAGWRGAVVSGGQSGVVSAAGVRPQSAVSSAAGCRGPRPGARNCRSAHGHGSAGLCQLMCPTACLCMCACVCGKGRHTPVYVCARARVCAGERDLLVLPECRRSQVSRKTARLLRRKPEFPPRIRERDVLFQSSTPSADRRRVCSCVELLGLSQRESLTHTPRPGPGRGVVACLRHSTGAKPSLAPNGQPYPTPPQPAASHPAPPPPRIPPRPRAFIPQITDLLIAVAAGVEESKWASAKVLYRAGRGGGGTTRGTGPRADDQKRSAGSAAPLPLRGAPLIKVNGNFVKAASTLWSGRALPMSPRPPPRTPAREGTAAQGAAGTCRGLACDYSAGRAVASSVSTLSHPPPPLQH